MTEKNIINKEKAIEEFKKMFDESVKTFVEEPIKTSFSKEEMEEIIDNFINSITEECLKVNRDKKEIYYVTEDRVEVRDRFEVEDDKIVVYREIKHKQPLEYIELKLEVSNEGVKVNGK